MAQARAGVGVNGDERRLIFAGYRAHGNNWGRVVAHLLQHAEPEGPVYQQYMQRNACQQRRRVRDVITRDIVRLQDRRIVDMRYAARGNPLERARRNHPLDHPAPPPQPNNPAPPEQLDHPVPPPQLNHPAPPPQQPYPAPPQQPNHPAPPHQPYHPAPLQPDLAAPPLQPFQPAPPPQLDPQAQPPPPQDGNNIPVPRLGEPGRLPLHEVVRRSHEAFYQYVTYTLPELSRELRQSVRLFNQYLEDNLQPRPEEP